MDGRMDGLLVVWLLLVVALVFVLEWWMDGRWIGCVRPLLCGIWPWFIVTNSALAKLTMRMRSSFLVLLPRSLPPSGLCAHFHRVVVLAFVYCVERFKRLATCKRIHHQVEYFWNGTMYIRTRASMVRMLGSSVLVPCLRNPGQSRKSIRD